MYHDDFCSGSVKTGVSFAGLQITQFTAVDADTGNNARITYRLVSSNRSNGINDYIFGIFPNSGWLYLNGTLDRESKDRYNLVVSAKGNLSLFYQSE